MDRSWRRWTLRLGTAGVIAVVAAVWPYRLLGGPATDQLDRMRGELDRTREAARAEREQIAELRREIEALKNQPGAIEDLARRELGMIMPGELVMRFEPGEPPAGAIAAPAPTPEAGAAPEAVESSGGPTVSGADDTAGGAP
ncbi:MAG TPA: septum formation initiator family protein [Kofleriaceae bacterium]|nr:septum formation initiator family protein [Kofleriaceae bacterium]